MFVWGVECSGLHEVVACFKSLMIFIEFDIGDLQYYLVGQYGS